MERKLTCIVCPMGCELTVEIENDKVLKVSGNTCPRGEKYAKTECISPMRTITTTVKCDNGEVLPVKTDRPIPKGKMLDCMKVINEAVAHLPICVGDVIIEDVYGARILATANMK